MRQMPAKVDYDLLIIPLALMGAGWGLFGSPIRSETLSAVPPERRGVGSAITVTMINVGFLASLAISIVIISSSVPHSIVLGVFGGGGLASGPGGGPPITDISDFMNGLHNVYSLLAGLCLFAIIPLVSVSEG